MARFCRQAWPGCQRSGFRVVSLSLSFYVQSTRQQLCFNTLSLSLPRLFVSASPADRRRHTAQLHENIVKNKGRTHLTSFVNQSAGVYLQLSQYRENRASDRSSTGVFVFTERETSSIALIRNARCRSAGRPSARQRHVIYFARYSPASAAPPPSFFRTRTVQTLEQASYGKEAIEAESRAAARPYASYPL